MSDCRSIAVCLTLVCGWFGAFRGYITSFQLRSLRANYPPTFLQFTRGKTPSFPASGSLSLFMCLLSRLFTVFARLPYAFSKRHLAALPQPQSLCSSDHSSRDKATLTRNLHSVSSRVTNTFFPRHIFNNSGHTSFSKFTIPGFVPSMLATFRQPLVRTFRARRHASQRIDRRLFSDRSCALSSHQSPPHDKGRKAVSRARRRIRNHTSPAKGEPNALDIGALFLFFLRELESLETGSFAVSPDSFWVPISIHFG